MGLFTKKEVVLDKPSEISSLPDIPVSSTAPVLNQVPQKTLPNLPNYDSNNGIMVTEVSDGDFYDTPITDMEKSSFPKVNNLPEKSSPNDPISKIINPPSNVPSALKPVPALKNSPPAAERRTQKKEEQIFVKLKKFEDSLGSFNEIRAKIDELTTELEKAKKLVVDEQKELEEWAKEITVIKSGLESIDKNLFSGFES